MACANFLTVALVQTAAQAALAAPGLVLCGRLETQRVHVLPGTDALPALMRIKE